MCDAGENIQIANDFNYESPLLSDNEEMRSRFIVNVKMFEEKYKKKDFKVTISRIILSTKLKKTA